MSDLVTKLARLDDRYRQLEERLGSDASLAAADRIRLGREHGRLSRLILPYQALCAAQEQLQAAQALAADPEMADLAREEIASLEAAISARMEEIKGLLVQADAFSDRPAMVEIRAGTGGDEACLFAGDLVRMYQMYCQRQQWRCEVLSLQEGEVGGVREAILLIKGEGAYGLMRFESGGHRVQRVPQTESQGRIHTSAATVAVMAEAEDIDVDIKPDDLQIDVFRASGAGGQHVNKTDSAVRITHLPSGLVVGCQDEKSQHANRDRAMKILRARLLDQERQRQEAERAAERRQQVGSGDRSDRIRTYNFPQNRITDHRIGYTGYHLDRYMEGHLEELQEAMLEDAKLRVLASWDGNY